MFICKYIHKDIHVCFKNGKFQIPANGMIHQMLLSSGIYTKERKTESFPSVWKLFPESNSKLKLQVIEAVKKFIWQQISLTLLIL